MSIPQSASSPESQPNPLERRHELGVPRAVLETIRDVLWSPARFFARSSAETSLLPALVLALVLQIPLGIASGAIQLTQLLSHPEVAAQHHVTLVGLVVGQVLGFVLYPVIAAIVAGVQWVLLFVVGARDATYAGVLRAMFYLHAVSLVYVVLAPIGIVLELIVPQGGLSVFLLYAVVAFVYVVIALANVARTSPWRVVVAQLIPLSLCCCIIPVASFLAWQAFGHHLH